MIIPGGCGVDGARWPWRDDHLGGGIDDSSEGVDGARHDNVSLPINAVTLLLVERESPEIIPTPMLFNSAVTVDDVEK